MPAVIQANPIELTDGTSVVGVAPANTAPTAAQPALVVAPSPNAPAPAPSDLTVTATLGALNASSVINTEGATTLLIRVSGTWVGTILVEVSVDDGASYPASVTPYNAGTFYPAGIVANGFYYVNVAGANSVRLFMSAYTSGVATATANAAVGAAYARSLSFVTDGSNVAGIAPANTAPTAAQPALVTTQSPNSPAATSALQATGNGILSTIATNTGAAAQDFIANGTITASGGSVSVTGQGVYTVTVSITGTWVGTLIVQGQLADNTWVQLPMYAFTPGAASLPYLAQASTTTNGTFIITGGGFQNIRVYASAYTSGTADVGLEGSLAQQTIFAAQLGQWNMSGSAVEQSGSISGNGNVIALPNGTSIPSIQGYAGVTFEVSGTWSGVLAVQGSNGGAYYAVPVLNMATPNAGPQATITANGLYYAPIGFLDLLLVMSNYVSGSVNVYSSLHAIPPALLPSNGTISTPQQIALGGAGGLDVFGALVSTFRSSQIQIPFYSAAPAALLTVTTTGSATTAQGTGIGTFSTGATAGSEAKGVTLTTLQYTPHNELFAAFTAYFTAGVAGGSYQRIGPYNATDGFSFGYNAATFGLWTRYNTADTFVAQTAWNQDTLSGAANSKFTSNGSPVALVPTDINLYRVRYGWLGGSAVFFDVYSPDGNWVTVHIAKFTNTGTTTSMTNPNVPITVDVSNGTIASSLVIGCGCWVGGSTGTPSVTSVANGQQALATIPAESQRPTYFISLQGFATGATNADVFNLIGSANKVIRVTRVLFSMTATTAVTIPLQLIKRSTANAGGTTGIAANGAYDSKDPAAAATNLVYTANATTLGTVVGTAVRSAKYFAEVATPTSAPELIEWTFGDVAKQPTLRSATESLCINLGGVTIAGGNVSCTYEWTEDSN